MNSNVILSSSVLDILFEKRNKKYGAYILRKFYPDRVKTSLLIMLGIVVIFSAFTFLPGRKIPIESPFDKSVYSMKQVDLPNDQEEKNRNTQSEKKSTTTIYFYFSYSER